MGLSCARGGFNWTVGKTYLLSVVRHWNKLPREVVELPSLEVLKKHAGVALQDTV